MFKFAINLLSLLISIQTQASEHVHALNTKPLVKNQQNEFVTVGAGASCDYSEIQAAIDSGDSDVIRIASDKPYLEHILIKNKSISLVGGYANCADAIANFTDLSQAIISGFGDGYIIKITTINDQSHEVLLRNLFIGNGKRGVDVFSHHPSAVSIILDHVRIYNNSALGMHIESYSGPADVILNDSQVDFNYWNGITCVGSKGSLILTGHSMIANNQHDTGSAVHVKSGCDLTIYSPTQIVDNEGTGIIVDDSVAVLFGGSDGCENGICFGDWSSPVTVSGNDGYHGGGLRADNGSLVIVVNALFEFNRTIYDIGGGALTAENESVVIAIGSSGGGENEQMCWSPGACLQFNNNYAYRGSVFRSLNGSMIDLSGSVMTKNNAHKAIIGSLEDGEAKISNSIIHNNGQDGTSRSLFDTFQAGKLALEYVTIANNLLINDSSSLIKNSTNGQIQAHSSVMLNEVGPVYQGNIANAHFECVMVRDDANIVADGTVVVVNDELDQIFVDTTQGDYHLAVGSSAIDYCYDIEGSTVDKDLDGKSRGVDHSGVTNFYGPYDIGAYEFDSENDDLIFKDGF